ncbi:S53 family peptidase [Burkholderia alba]|uniref:S53 family peptidase n=1 Tax=Burkholderia alba TaxID=2683677 RepID=UPI002B05F751|nr:S53 family peptidase [Burkholderia alba]
MQKTKHAVRQTSKRLTLALLPLAIASTLLPLSARAASDWVSTHTSAFLVPNAPAAPAASGAARARTASDAAAGYTLNSTGTPELANSAVTPLELSQPLHITVSLKSRNEAQLDAFLKEVNDPQSANYQKFLTPAEFKARFAPTDAQVQAVVDHLKASGFSNIDVSANNQLVTADGNATNVQTAFHATIKRFTYKGKPVYANDSAALVPSSLGPIVNSVLGLQNAVTPHPYLYRAANVGADAAKAAAGSQAAHQPTDFAKIYNASSLPAATNTTVGIITWGDVSQVIKDLDIFTKNAGLPTTSTKTVKAGTGTFAASDPGEWDLDSQDIIGTSGGVKQLILYTGANGDSRDSAVTEGTIATIITKAVTDNEAKIINVSLGEDETAANATGAVKTTDAAFKQAVAQGQIFSVSSGDAGVYQWSYSPQGQPGVVGTNSGGGVKTTVDLSKYSVSWPAHSPNVVAVGGTTLSTTNKTTWSGETVWNEGLAYADVDDQGNLLDYDVRLWATGGGVSQFEAAPAWQTAALGSSITKRVLPDVSFDAAQASGAYLVFKGKTGYGPVGGTSLASPIFVGGFARVLSAHNNSIGLPTSGFYKTFATDKTVLHDVTSGNNGYSGHGYSAKSGWDYATGYGSLDFGKLSATYK